MQVHQLHMCEETIVHSWPRKVVLFEKRRNQGNSWSLLLVDQLPSDWGLSWTAHRFPHPQEDQRWRNHCWIQDDSDIHKSIAQIAWCSIVDSKDKRHHFSCAIYLAGRNSSNCFGLPKGFHGGVRLSHIFCASDFWDSIRLQSIGICSVSFYIAYVAIAIDQLDVENRPPTDRFGCSCPTGFSTPVVVELGTQIGFALCSPDGSQCIAWTIGSSWLSTYPFIQVCWLWILANSNCAFTMDGYKHAHILGIYSVFEIDYIQTHSRAGTAAHYPVYFSRSWL